MKHPTLLNFFIFTCFLVVGYTLSIRFYHDGTGYNSMQAREFIIGSDSAKALNNGQHSILLVGIDALDTSNPQLISLWQVSYLPSNPTLHAYPIYPAGKSSPSSFEQSIGRTFSLDQGNGSLMLGQGFIRLLMDNNYWWDGYFIYDQIALSEMVYSMGHAQTDQEPMADNVRLIDLSNYGGNPRDTFSTQLAVMQMSCQYIHTMRNTEDWSQLILRAPNHVYSDMDLPQEYMEWKNSLTDDQSMNCRFPTLEFSRSEE